MAMNFNHCNSISSFGLGQGNESILLSSTDSNLGFNNVRDGGLIGSNLGLGLGQLGLISHDVTIFVKKTYTSTTRVDEVDCVTFQNRPATFPLTEVTTVTEVLKTTTHFLTSASTLEAMFASSSRVSNRGIFSTNGFCIQAQPPTLRNQPCQVMNFLRSQNPSMNHEALHIFNHNNNIHGNFMIPTSVYNSYDQGRSFDQTAAILRNLQNNLNMSNYNMNQERVTPSPSYINPVRSVLSNQLVRDQIQRSPQRNQASIHNSLEKVSNQENDYDDYHPLQYDGRTHSLPDYPEGVYGCPKCFDTFYTSQTFAAHIRSHYKKESKEEKRRRMAAKFKQKNLRLLSSTHGLLTAMPKSSKGMAKGSTMKRKNQIAMETENLEELVHQAISLNDPAVANKKGPISSVMIKEEPCSS